MIHKESSLGHIVDAAKIVRGKGFDIVTNTKLQVVVASGLCGGFIDSIGFAAAGSAVGGVVGAAAGIIPAVFTFGLSVPVGGTIGAACGLLTGFSAGATVGTVSGGAIGYGVYTKRDAIRSIASKAKHEVGKKFGQAKEKVTKTAIAGKEKASALVQDKRFQVTAASATGGAVAVGANGAVAGLAAGGAVGAAVGMVPAIFTFGLSIPLFAAIGSGCGAAAGAVAGGSTGMLIGGAGGYGAYTHREAIGSSWEQTKSKMDEAAGSMRARLVAATGGTAQ